MTTELPEGVTESAMLAMTQTSDGAAMLRDILTDGEAL